MFVILELRRTLGAGLAYVYQGKMTFIPEDDIQGCPLTST